MTAFLGVGKYEESNCDGRYGVCWKMADKGADTKRDRSDCVSQKMLLYGLTYRTV